MKRRCVFSISVVSALAAWSAAAFVSSLSGMEADRTLVKRAELKAVPMVKAGAVNLIGQDIKEMNFVERASEISYQTIAAYMDLGTEDRYFLAKIAMAEAEGEDTEGKALVMLAVLNRMADDGFPDTVQEVVCQPGQFSSLLDGRFASSEPDADCWAALDLVMQDKWDGSYGATYFESKSESAWHSENLEFLFQHGRHYFYIDREGKSG